MHNRSYLISFVACFLTTLSAVAAINYHFDPAHLFKEGFERDIAQIMLSGKNVGNFTNCDDRQLQKYYIELVEKPSDVVVMGSSRAMRIDKRCFPGRSFFNHSVVNATLEDYIAIYEFLHKRKLTPHLLVLGMEPYSLNRANGKIGWKTLEPVFLEGAARLNINPNFQMAGVSRSASSNKYLQLISLGYLESSYAFGKDALKGSKHFPTDETLLDEAVKLTDGSRNYPRSYQSRSETEILRLALDQARARPVDGLAGYSKLDPVIMDALEKFIASLEAEGVQVAFYLPPYHPAMYDILVQSEQYKIIDQAESYFRQLAGKHGITCVGSFDPKNIPCAPTEFYDGCHPADICVEKMFKEIGGRAAVANARNIHT